MYIFSFSSELSGTYQSSVVIKEEVKETYANLDLEIIDTKCASLGQGLVVLEAAKMAKTRIKRRYFKAC